MDPSKLMRLLLSLPMNLNIGSGDSNPPMPYGALDGVKINP